MKIQGDSIVDTVIKFAKQHFNVELDIEDVSDQLKKLSFADNLELIDVIKGDDIEMFKNLITFNNVEEAYGTDQTAGASRATVRAANNAQRIAARRANSGARGGGYGSAPAGAKNIKPTGARAMADPDDAERQSNTNGVQNNNAEIQRLKDVVGKLISKGK
jgi:hypothetical protein